MSDKSQEPNLWTERSVEETQQVYSEWADSYDTDLAPHNYRTPERLAQALMPHLPQDTRPVLDFGCGTGLSGAALRSLGVGSIDGTDISADMLAKARPKEIYGKLWVSEPGCLEVSPGTYRAIIATGVISLGAAPPETLDLLLGKLAPGDVLALSFNDPTLENGSYDRHLEVALHAGSVEVLERTHGPHLQDKGMGSDVIVLKRL